jgi:hypothetical protein
LYDEIKVFGQNKEGFILPLWLMVKLDVDLQGDLSFIGFIRPTISNNYIYDYIILN